MLEPVFTLPEVAGVSEKSHLQDVFLEREFKASKTLSAFLSTVFECSPFLKDCACKENAFLINLLNSDFDSQLEDLLQQTRKSGLSEHTESELMQQLRIAKRRAALLCGLADLGGWWQDHKVTLALSQFAEASLSATIDYILLQQHASSNLTLSNTDVPQEECGLIILGMGKLGGGELNYSSDIDLITFFDDQSAIVLNHDDPITLLNRMAKQLIKIMQERTSDGYVFRTDLRLRPDPSSTPLIIPVDAALNYYEGQGQNWERSAMIKAKPVAGDYAAAKRFLKYLEPFVWRKYLDFAAINDVHSIKRQIHAHKGHGEIAVYSHNIKLGRGGIREVEFFAQTQQLIAGGRNAELRPRETISALQALCAAGWIEKKTVSELTNAYWFLRRVEHRIQMIRDEQTHVLPDSEDEMKVIAALCGYAGAKSFTTAVQEILECVEHHYAALFEGAPGLSSECGNLVFTGDDLDPETIKTLTNMGYQRPEQIILIIKAWHVAKVPALQATQARELLTELIPFLLETFARTENPDDVIFAFDRFVMGLPAGIQLFSILKNNPGLTNLLVKILDCAPRLAEQISKKPHVFDAMLEPAQDIQQLDQHILEQRIAPLIARAHQYEGFLDAMRRFASEIKFEIGTRHFGNRETWQRSAAEYTVLAEVIIAATFERVLEEFAEAHGHLPGARVCVLAMGRLGSAELTSTSDLDLIFLYDLADQEAVSDGKRPLDSSLYFIRLLQRFITAMTAPTAEGVLYSLDFRLRPSGNAGPLATAAEGFFKYQKTEAWVWEAQALTRARPVYGDPDLCQTVTRKCSEILHGVNKRHSVLPEIKSMRERILKEKGSLDVWDLKNVSGGFIDIEFIAQACVLLCPNDTEELTATEDILSSKASGKLLGENRQELRQAFDLFSTILHLQRICLWDTDTATDFPAGFKTVLCQRLDLPSFEACEAELAERQKKVREIFKEFFARTHVG
ncbi:MAG: bifunctional [glutamine synthetase] adenylyltransferase/[glutamine synthetase]-adenylyl-L-tyrosine phosphorylase [Rhizobiaceae bacterium]|nr:bifunctional [glutamine synthetase] adenylyltransferase/[glutamine synthetase]-adenylyl-L-tyrosine phosphorylase [Rhizobiaceae bacterium]